MRNQRNRRVKPPTTPKREPTTERAWQRLMLKVIARAEQLKDPLAQTLKLAVSQGRQARTLKRMRIICDNDILRVFPDP